MGLRLYTIWRRLTAAALSYTVRRDFAKFGPGARIFPPLRAYGAGNITIGRDVMFESDCWLQSLKDGQIIIGDGVRCSGGCTISAADRVELEADVLLARNVHIIDNQHETRNPAIPVRLQGIARVAPVLICEGAWIGTNAVILPGVTVGRNAVVGANAVVARDVPDRAVAVGVPARIQPSASTRSDPSGASASPK